MNSFSGRNAHHAPASIGTPITIRIHLFRDNHESLFVFIVFLSRKKSGSMTCPMSSLPFESLELLQRHRPEVRVEPLTVDRNRPELRQVRSRGNFVILVAFIPFQFSQLHLIRVVFQEVGIIHCVLRRHQDHVHIRPVRSLEVGQPQHQLSVRLLIDRRAARSGVHLAMELARLQRLCLAVVHHFVVLHLVVFHVVLFHAVLFHVVLLHGVLFHVVLRVHRWLEQKRTGQRRECQTCLDRANHSDLSSTLSFGGRFLRPLIPFALYESAARQRLQPPYSKRSAVLLLPAVYFSREAYSWPAAGLAANRYHHNA